MRIIVLICHDQRFIRDLSLRRIALRILLWMLGVSYRQNLLSYWRLIIIRYLRVQYRSLHTLSRIEYHQPFKRICQLIQYRTKLMFGNPEAPQKTSRWVRKCARRAQDGQHGANMVPEFSRNNANMEPKSIENGVDEMMKKWLWPGWRKNQISMAQLRPTLYGHFPPRTR